MMPPTKDEHDAIVAVKRRNFTDGPMRHAKNGDDRNVDDGPSVLDGFVVEFILKAQQ